MTTPDDIRADLLRATLEAAVPLRIAELRGLRPGTRALLASYAAADVAEHGDKVLYVGPKRGDTAAAVGSLITGLACCAFAPGGVRFAGLHWEDK